MWELRILIHLSPEIKNDFRCADFHEARYYTAWSHGDFRTEFHISRPRYAEIRGRGKILFTDVRIV